MAAKVSGWRQDSQGGRPRGWERAEGPRLAGSRAHRAFSLPTPAASPLRPSTRGLSPTGCSLSPRRSPVHPLPPGEVLSLQRTEKPLIPGSTDRATLWGAASRKWGPGPLGKGTTVGSSLEDSHPPVQFGRREPAAGWRCGCGVGLGEDEQAAVWMQAAGRPAEAAAAELCGRPELGSGGVYSSGWSPEPLPSCCQWEGESP